MKSAYLHKLDEVNDGITLNVFADSKTEKFNKLKEKYARFSKETLVELLAAKDLEESEKTPTMTIPNDGGPTRLPIDYPFDNNRIVYYDDNMDKNHSYKWNFPNVTCSDTTFDGCIARDWTKLH